MPRFHTEPQPSRFGGGFVIFRLYEVSVAKSEPIELEAVVTLALPNAMFKLKLDNSDREILGIVSGKDAQTFHPHPPRRPRQG